MTTYCTAYLGCQDLRSERVRTITVSKDSSGDYKTIQEALESIPIQNTSSLKIYVHKGVYEEKLLIQKPFITIEGESPEQTIITYGDYGKMLMANGEKRGTFRTSTVMIDANYVTVKNLTIRNDAGPGHLVGQAIALYADGDHLEFEHCRILGWQDTLFIGPLPPKPLIENGFAGPKEDAPRIHGRQYYKKCYIEGNIEFICRSGTAYFDNCERFAKSLEKQEEIREEEIKQEEKRKEDTKGYITAPSTPQDKRWGFIFYHCRFTSNCPPDTVYLGRPWRNYAKAVLIHCHLGAHIKEEGWSDWNKVDARKTVYFGEYKSIGEGRKGISLGKRVSWSKQLTTEESKEYKKARVFL